MADHPEVFVALVQQSTTGFDALGFGLQQEPTFLHSPEFPAEVTSVQLTGDANDTLAGRDWSRTYLRSASRLTR